MVAAVGRTGVSVMFGGPTGYTDAVDTSTWVVAELDTWRTVGAVVERVASEAQRQTDLLEDLRRLGIDEISHRKGQR